MKILNYIKNNKSKFLIIILIIIFTFIGIKFFIMEAEKGCYYASLDRAVKTYPEEITVGTDRGKIQAGALREYYNDCMERVKTREKPTW